MKKNLFLKGILFLFLYLAVIPRFAPVHALADLILTGFNTCWEVYRNEEFKVDGWKAWTWVKVKNRGTVASGPFKVTVSYDGNHDDISCDSEISDLVSFGSILPGKTKIVQDWLFPAYEQFHIDPSPLDSGMYCLEGGYDAVVNNCQGPSKGGPFLECGRSDRAGVVLDSYLEVEEGLIGEENNVSYPTFAPQSGSLVPGRKGLSCGGAPVPTSPPCKSLSYL